MTKTWLTYANATRLFLSLTLALLAVATPPLRNAVLDWIGADTSGGQIIASFDPPSISLSERSSR